MINKSVLVRLCAAAFLADMALYLVMTGAPYKALALGAGPLVLGFLPVARALPYSLTAIWAGEFTEGKERLRLARGSLVLTGLAVMGLIAVSSIPWIYVLLGLVGFTLAFFWPAVQATLADVARRGTVTGNLGWFNISWSTGKATGFLIGGFLLSGLGFGAVFAAAALAIFAVAFLVATLPAFPRSPESVEGDSPSTPPRPDTSRFRLASWIGNSVAFGIGAVLNTHYPEWLEAHDRGEALFGSFLALIFGSQTVAFALLARFPGWHFRKIPLVAGQLPLIVVLAILPRLDHPAAILATAPWIGFGLGMTYFASLYYSVHTPTSRGRNAGVHEALLGLGAMILPALGGWVASASGRLEAPYLVAAGVGMVAVGVQTAILSLSPRGGGGNRREQT